MKSMSFLKPSFVRPSLAIGALLFFGPWVGADPSFRVVDSSTLEVSWESMCGKQYGLSYSPDLLNWSPLGPRQLGVDGRLAMEADLRGGSRGFYRVEEFTVFSLDVGRFKFGTVGNRWSYDVEEEGVLGDDSYIWDSEIRRRTTFHGKDVLEWQFDRDGVWDQTIYLLDDFSTGIFEVGGENPVEGAQTNDPPVPSMLVSFIPGIATPLAYNSSALGQVAGDLTITVDKDPVTVGAGTFRNLIKVVQEYTGSISGIDVLGTTTEWFALEVGLVKHVGEVDAGGFILTTTFSLRSYQVN